MSNYDHHVREWALYSSWNYLNENPLPTSNAWVLNQSKHIIEALHDSTDLQEAVDNMVKSWIEGK